MTRKLLLTMAVTALLLASPIRAQTTGGSFASLSPGNQKIATALFSAQNTAGTTQTPLTLDQIAALKASQGWGQVFKQMKADGLIQAKNLGQVVSGHEHQLHASRGATTSATISHHSHRSLARVSSRMHREMSHRRSVAGSSHGMGSFGHVSVGGGSAHSVGGGFGGGFGGGMGGVGHGGGHGR